jgi:hypothetical protein
VDGPQPVARIVGGLQPETSYDYRVVAIDAGGMTYGAAKTFTTARQSSSVTDEPTITTDDPVLTATSADLAADLATGDSPATYRFEFGTDQYDSSSPLPDALAAPSQTQVSTHLTGLTPGTAYHYRVVATDAAGTTVGPDEAFTTPLHDPPPPTPPTATTVAAASVDASSATLRATIDPRGEATSYHFEYGPTTTYGPTTSAGDLPATSGALPVSATIPGLDASTTYHYRIVATNADGTTDGEDQTFTTAPATSEPPPTTTPPPPPTETTPTPPPTQTTTTPPSKTTPNPQPKAPTLTPKDRAAALAVVRDSAHGRGHAAPRYSCAPPTSPKPKHGVLKHLLGRRSYAVTSTAALGGHGVLLALHVRGHGAAKATVPMIRPPWPATAPKARCSSTLGYVPYLATLRAKNLIDLVVLVDLPRHAIVAIQAGAHSRGVHVTVLPHQGTLPPAWA